MRDQSPLDQQRVRQEKWRWRLCACVPFVLDVVMVLGFLDDKLEAGRLVLLFLLMGVACVVDVVGFLVLLELGVLLDSRQPVGEPGPNKEHMMDRQDCWYTQILAIW